MKTYQILLYDRITNKVEPETKIKTNDLEEVRQEMLKLQAGYCEGEEKPTIGNTVIDSDQGKISCLIAETPGVDFCYLCPVALIEE